MACRGCLCDDPSAGYMASPDGQISTLSTLKDIMLIWPKIMALKIKITVHYKNKFIRPAGQGEWTYNRQ